MKLFPPCAFIASVICLLAGAAHAQDAATIFDCAKEGQGLKSEVSDQSTHVRFVNDNPEARTIYWLNFDGYRVFYMRLEPGQAYDQQTYVSHPWVITADNLGTCTMGIMPSPQTTIAHLR